jgi:hypothetical protein
MLELADIFRRYEPEYRARFGKQMLPSHIPCYERYHQLPYTRDGRSCLSVQKLFMPNARLQLPLVR